MQQMMKLLVNTYNNITKNKNGENVPHVEVTKVELVHYNIVSNSYQHNSRVLHTSVSNK